MNLNFTKFWHIVKIDFNIFEYFNIEIINVKH
jgi:hypothetical protein